jgi:uncharacterized protein YuzE
MKIEYFADTDTLYISLVEHPSVESEEVAEGFVVDLDDEGRVVGIEIDPAKGHVDLQRLRLTGITGEVETAAA